MPSEPYKELILWLLTMLYLLAFILIVHEHGITSLPTATRKIPKDIWALKSIIDHASELKKNATTNSLVFAQARQILRWSARLLLRAPELVKTREGREYLRPRIACLIMKLSRAADRILEETYEERREIENKQTKVNQAIRILREGLSLTTVRTALYKHKETAV